MSNSTALMASAPRSIMEIAIRLIREVGAEGKRAVAARGGRDLPPGAPGRGMVAPMELGRDERHLLACGEMPLDRLRGDPVALEAVEPDAGGLVVIGGRRLKFAVAREDAGVPPDVADRVRHG